MVIISALPRIHTLSIILDNSTPDTIVDTHRTFRIKPGANFLSKDEVELWEGRAGVKAVKAQDASGKKPAVAAVAEVAAIPGLKDLAEVKVMIEKAHLRVIEDAGKPKGKGNPVPESLDGMDHTMKLELIRSVFEAETLATWKDEETDTDVITVINEQLKMIQTVDAQRAEAQKAQMAAA